MGMKGCYDGGECVQWHACRPGDCAVREQVERMRSQEHEEAQTQRLAYTGEETEFIPGDLLHDYIEHPYTGQETRVIGNVEPETMSYRIFEFRKDQSLNEEEVANLRDRFTDLNNRSMSIWCPSEPTNAMARTHHCLFCWLVSKLPGHHRCDHGRLVCEQCELRSAGW
jgi:hypothetical protein